MVVAKLNIEPAERSGLLEHLTLNMTGPVPGRFSTGGGIHCKYQAPALSGSFANRGCPDGFQESVDCRLARFLRKLFVSACHGIRLCTPVRPPELDKQTREPPQSDGRNLHDWPLAYTIPVGWNPGLSSTIRQILRSFVFVTISIKPLPTGLKCIYWLIQWLD